MSMAKQAFDDVREASKRVQDQILSLKDLAALRKDTLGWNSNVAKFRKFADAQLKQLPRGDEQKNVIRSQKEDLRIAIAELRTAMDGYEVAIRSQRSSKQDNKISARYQKAVIQIEDAVRRMIDIDPEKTAEFLQGQLERCGVSETSEETVEV